MEQYLDKLSKKFSAHFLNIKYINDPKNLYTPIEHILKLKGKRVRPLILLLIYDMLNKKIDKKILDLATAIELFHNFTLIHDDIIDNSDFRRGEQTVHKKYGINSGILSGDALMILAYQKLECVDTKILHKILSTFNTIAIGICEGQQMDINFETSYKVSIAQYFKMIELKTSILIGLAFQIPIILKNLSASYEKIFFEIGKNLGTCYQIQDDYLDTFGVFEKFGKPIGNDISLNKKTFLSITALKDANASQKSYLQKLQTEKNKTKKIKHTLAIFNQLDIKEKTLSIIDAYYYKIYTLINDIDIFAEKDKQKLKKFINTFIKREI